MQTTFTIRKRKDSGKWQAIIRQKENNTWKQVESKTFEKKMQATQWSNKRSVYWQGKIETDYENMTIKELKVLYLNYQKPRVKENTFITIRTNINNADWFDDRKPLEIKPHEVDDIISSACYSHFAYIGLFFNYLYNHLKLNNVNIFKNKLIDIPSLNGFVNHRLRIYYKNNKSEGLTYHDFKQSFIRNLVK